MVYELKAKLAKRGIGEDAIDAILAKVSIYMDDNAEIERFILSQFNKGFGPKIISYKLSIRTGRPYFEFRDIIETLLPLDLQRDMVKKLIIKKKSNNNIINRGFNLGDIIDLLC